MAKPKSLQKLDPNTSSNTPAVLDKSAYGKVPYYDGGWTFMKGNGFSYKSLFLSAFDGDKILSLVEPITVHESQLTNFRYYPDPQGAPSTYVDNLFADNARSAWIFPVAEFYDHKNGQAVENNSKKFTHWFNETYATTKTIYIQKPKSLDNIGVTNSLLIHNRAGNTANFQFFVPNAWCDPAAGSSQYPLQSLGGMPVVCVSGNIVSAFQTSLIGDKIYGGFSIKTVGAMLVEYTWIFENVTNKAGSDVVTSRVTNYATNYNKLYNLKLVINVSTLMENVYAV